MAYGFVYVLANEAMPNIYKIGCTERSPSKRAEELSNSTSVPTPFFVVCYGEFREFQGVEYQMHQYFADKRVNAGREFFYGPLQQIVDQLSRGFVEMMNFCYGESEMLISAEAEADEKRFKQHHFYLQSADPIHWPERHGGFE